MTINKKFFEDLLRDRGMSFRRLSKELALPPSQMSFTMNGRRRMQLDEAVRISQILGVSLQDVAVNAGIGAATLSMQRVPVSGWLNGSGEVQRLPDNVRERTTPPDGLPPNVVAVQCRTLDTALSWMDGAVMFACNERVPPDGSRIGHLCWIKIAGGPEVVATLRRGYDPGTYNLSGPCGNKESQKLEWADPILLVRP